MASTNQKVPKTGAVEASSCLLLRGIYLSDQMCNIRTGVRAFSVSLMFLCFSVTLCTSSKTFKRIVSIFKAD